MSDAVQAWLALRRPPPPPSLAVSMGRFVRGVDIDEAGGVPEHLAAAGLAALAAALERPEERAGALDLLAADALLTYTFEAAAEDGPAAVDRLARRLAPARLAPLLEPRDP